VATRYVVGIDLGTTHTVVAYTEAGGDSRVRVLEMERLVAAGQVQRLPTLPTVLYALLAEESDTAESWVVGDYARRRGQEVSARAIMSAKSWLCHAGVDRQAAILPWGAPADVPRLSPVAASTHVLEHVRRAWDSRFPDSPLVEQQIVLTVPASFDPIARQLTVKAALDAGLAVRLLEEPQAAFYDYLDQQGTQALERLLPQSEGRGLRILVCDVGGGTTDLTLLRVKENDTGICVDRMAVGRHLLLGGDNMDLALAHLAESQLSSDQRFDAYELVKWVLVCREAKEQLLREDGPSEANVAVGRSGSQLVGNARSTTLARDSVLTSVLDGFFPWVDPQVRSVPKRSALLGFGLPYESDPAISRHICAFMDRHLTADDRVDAVLLNGGVFLSPLLANRVLQVLEKVGHPCRLLSHLQPDLAVARGAVKYGLSLNGQGLKIGGGSAHGYYAAFDSPDGDTRRLAICVVPRGSAEGEPHRAAVQRFTLRLGVPVRFELYSSDVAAAHAPGTVVELDEQFELLPPLVTQLTADDSARQELSVYLEGELTAVGTLELFCVPTAAADRGNALQLAFELRGLERPQSSTSPPRPSKPPRQERLSEAYELIQRVFGKGRGNIEPRETKDLFRNLERLLGDRGTWTLDVNRALFDVVAPKSKARHRSVDHERLYFMLVGFTLRPGFGHILDRSRVSLLSPLLAEGLHFTDQVRSWQQFLIAWRRILPGMTETEQTRAYEILSPFVSKARNRSKPPRAFQGIVFPELLDLVGLFERLPAHDRIGLGNTLIERTWTEREPRLWEATGRVGSRVPLYASAHYVIAPREAENWIEQLMREKWEDLPSAAKAAVNLSRMTGDRARDVSNDVRTEVIRRLERHKAPSAWIKSISETTPVAASESLSQYGEELPVGLVWHPPDD
jgi:molecular chaperone DnaK (HSP70)